MAPRRFPGRICLVEALPELLVHLGRTLADVAQLVRRQSDDVFHGLYLERGLESQVGVQEIIRQKGSLRVEAQNVPIYATTFHLVEAMLDAQPSAALALPTRPANAAMRHRVEIESKSGDV